MRPRSWKILRWLNQSTHSRVDWFEVVESTPWSPVADQFGLVEADDRLGHALSKLSPRDPTEDTAPFSASRSV